MAELIVGLWDWCKANPAAAGLSAVVLLAALLSAVDLLTKER
jgi:hypothetical protein